MLSSLLLHHLTRDFKEGTIREVRRILRPSGEFHLADWGRPHNLLMRLAFLPVQLLDGFETTADSVRGALPGFIESAGFEVRRPARYATVFGSLDLLSARSEGGPVRTQW